MKLKGNCEIFLNIRMNYGCLVLEFYVKKKKMECYKNF